MKKTYLLAFIALSAVALSGCQLTGNTSSESENTITSETTSQDVVNAPPSPPEPTRETSN